MDTLSNLRETAVTVEERTFWGLCGTLNSTKAQHKKRICMRCKEKRITSFHYGHRLCGNCHTINEGKGNIYAVNRSEVI